MPTSKVNEKCFIIMPITTPENLRTEYKGDPNHFSHVLDHLFIPALKNAGFDPIPPKSIGSDVIQAEIIKHLASSELVLCDMSILNPNVFFEFGIRTALNKPVALVVDDKTEKVPFDTSIINFHRYKSSLDIWSLTDETNALAKHIGAAYTKTKDYNALWKYFGVAQIGVFKPEEASMGEKIDLLMKEVASLKTLSAPIANYDDRFAYMLIQGEKERQKPHQELCEYLSRINLGELRASLPDIRRIEELRQDLYRFSPEERRRALYHIGNLLRTYIKEKNQEPDSTGEKK
jgi:hypothetical protein